MAQYTQDGGVIPSGMPTSQQNSNDHYSLFGLYRGTIVKIVYPDEPENRNKERIEYTVRVRGQDYPHAFDATDVGGIYNYHTRTRQAVTNSLDDKIADETPREKMNGEVVFVMFIEGHGDIPMIVASDRHPRHTEYKKVKKDDGMFDIEEFNGIEISINKNSDYLIKNVGVKDDKGKVKSEVGVGSQIKMSGNGDIEVNTHGTTGTADLRAKFTKADKKMEFYAQNNKVVYDSNGVSIIDKNNNEFTFKSTGMSMKAVDKMALQATGDVSIKSDAKASLEGTSGTDVGSAASETNINGQIVNLAGGGLPVARVGDQVIGVGNLGAPVISSIVQGSPLVTSG